MFRKIMSKLDQCCEQSHSGEGKQTLDELKTLFEKLINRNSHEL
jgi:hypothetical protein